MSSKIENYSNDVKNFDSSVDTFYVGNVKRISSNTDNSYPTAPQGGGCLIATATYGSEMSQQVQQLRELRDNQLLQTESGTAFMGTFNDVYYSFSPTIADMEREHPLFKEAVKLAFSIRDKLEIIGVIASLTASLNSGCSLSMSAIVGLKE
jgi:peptidyl-prolyl cis-trans isomerase B (cyclophilin B)